MERHFEKDLNELKERLLWMGSLAERAVHQAVHAVLDSDEQLAKRVLDEEDAINELQLEIDDRVVQLLALHQLMAVDLRFRAGRFTDQQRSGADWRPGGERGAGSAANFASSAREAVCGLAANDGTGGRAGAQRA